MSLLLALIITLLPAMEVPASAVLEAPAQSGQYVPGIYPEGSTRYLTYNDLAGLSKWQLRVMRNEIYARHNYIFKSRDLIDYFNRQSWYSGYYSDAAVVYQMFSRIEIKNIEFIKSFEEGKVSRPSGGNSGVNGVPGVYPEGSTRYLTYDDLYGLSKWQLRVMRNEIYARHHYIFKSKDLIDYFSRQSWYRGLYTDSGAVYKTFSKIEISNIQLIQAFEK